MKRNERKLKDEVVREEGEAEAAGNGSATERENAERNDAEKKNNMRNEKRREKEITSK